MLLNNKKRPILGLLYLDHVLRFFDRSNFHGWPDKIETVIYHWGNDKERFVDEVRRKKIDILIGNIPATAYETFREIARELPDVQFLPSMDTQFSNKCKENVTHFCEKYHLPIPRTRIFYDMETARHFIENTSYPKIVKRSYGPSNYGGYYVHKVDSAEEALALFKEKHYFPVYMQDFVPMKADIRVMLIGHKPVCAFWRRPPEGEWLTNTSQGGSMDYMNVPQEALDIAVDASRAANAEYWACDIAVSHDDQFTILECATAFAAFPYIRDWIGQYLMWKLSCGTMPKPYIPMYNWEELGKISSSLLRTMRYITFGHAEQQAMTDTGELPCSDTSADSSYPMQNTHCSQQEEWPSEIWNRMAQHGRTLKTSTQMIESPHYQPESANEMPLNHEDFMPEKALTLSHQKSVSFALPAYIAEAQTTEVITPKKKQVLPRNLSRLKLHEFLISVRGIGDRMADTILDALGTEGFVEALEHDPQKLTCIKNIKEKKLSNIMFSWKRCPLTNTLH
ncbi:Alpha-aminoadipate--LysW ligase LysX [invertebrate metagenome]|uniref:Alpha-aminoadipate--LysW ligase LysX n=1 Tax=invertebrate metagenome TaxID=1711999 RepID=A0A2H9TAJ4_9ZZZZ